MDKRDVFTILNFLKIVLYLWIIKPLTILILINMVTIYIPCKIICNRDLNIIVSMIIMFVMLGFTYSMAYGLWDKYTYRVKIFSGETYMKTMGELHKMNYNFPDYMKCVSCVNKASSYLLSKKHLAGFLGIFIDYLTLFVIYKPFKGIVQW